MVAASRWVSEITSIALQMTLPPVAGFWLDRKFGTDPWWVAIGACLGMFVAMTSLVQLSKRTGLKSYSSKKLHNREISVPGQSAKTDRKSDE